MGKHSGQNGTHPYILDIIRDTITCVILLLGTALIEVVRHHLFPQHVPIHTAIILRILEAVLVIASLPSLVGAISALIRAIKSAFQGASPRFRRNEDAKSIRTFLPTSKRLSSSFKLGVIGTSIVVIWAGLAFLLQQGIIVAITGIIVATLAFAFICHAITPSGKKETNGGFDDYAMGVGCTLAGLLFGGIMSVLLTLGAIWIFGGPDTVMKLIRFILNY